MIAQLETTRTSLDLKRKFSAPLAQVYRAWTDPEMMDKWFHPDAGMRSSCTIDLRIGGSYEIQMHPPEEGEPFIVGGVYQEIIPQEKLVFTWAWQGEGMGGESLITVLFRALGDGETELTLRHENFSGEEERDNHAQGWKDTFDQLSAALA